MKKSLSAVLILAVLLLVSCAPDIVRSGGVVEHSAPSPTADLDEAYDGDDDIIVYITKSGTKYHREDCHHLSDSKIPITLEQAKERGLEPCSVCNPPE